MKRDTVGVRELRQNLSVYLRQVAAGRSLRVTERGKTVAALVPLHDAESPLEQLMKQGRLIPAQGDLLALSPNRSKSSSRVSRALEDLRDERL